MKFKQVEAFRATVQTGSMTTAAEQLHTSQPNISRLIAQLEKAAGFPVFVRVAGRLQLTQEGAELFRDVDRAFVSLKSLEDTAEHIRRSGTGRLRVGAVPSIALTWMPKVIRRFKEAHRDVAISLHTNDSPRVAQWVGSQFCDLGVVSYCKSRCNGDRLRTDGQITRSVRIPGVSRSNRKIGQHTNRFARRRIQRVVLA